MSEYVIADTEVALDMTTWPAFERLSQDLKTAANSLSVGEVRYFVDAYYVWQEDRMRSDNQLRALIASGEPHAVVRWLAGQDRILENQIARVLNAYTESQFVGRWSKSIVGIGPIISAGLLAHIDITKAPTAGHIWRFAGLDPTVSWEKGEKRPWNASLKTLCWKIGESFVKVCNHKDDVYGHLYAERKAIEQAKNDAHMFADQAAAKLAKCKIRKTTEAYKAYIVGLLPPAHVHARAKRWAVKLFLSHWHAVAYRHHYGTMPPKPYILTPAGGHAHEIGVPNWPF